MLKLWKKNKVDEEYTLTDEEVISKFREWCDVNMPGSSVSTTFMEFISRPGGLDSSVEPQDARDFLDEHLAAIMAFFF